MHTNKDNVRLVVEILILIGAFFLFTCYVNREACYGIYPARGYPVRWGVVQGCQVNKDGKWVAADTLNTIAK